MSLVQGQNGTTNANGTTVTVVGFTSPNTGKVTWAKEIEFWNTGAPVLQVSTDGGQNYQDVPNTNTAPTKLKGVISQLTIKSKTAAGGNWSLNATLAA